MTKILLPLCAALLLLPATSFAAPAPSTITDEGAVRTENGAVQELIFGVGDEIEGEVLSPDGAPVGGMRHKQLESMITIRTQFITQLIAISSDI